MLTDQQLIKILSNRLYKLLKVDTIDNTPISEDILNKICDNIKKIKSDIIILSDFRHGIFNKYSIKKIINSIPNKKFKVADSQVASRWGNIVDFKNLIYYLMKRK